LNHDARNREFKKVLTGVTGVLKAQYLHVQGQAVHTTPSP